MARGTRTFLITAVAGVAALIPAVGASAAGTLDQQQTINNFGGLQVDNANSKAQTFTAGITGQLDQVDLDLNGISLTTPLTVQIRDGSAAGPGTTVLATTTVPTSAVPGGETVVSVPFTSPAAVTAGTQYAIVAMNDSVGWFWVAGQVAMMPDAAYTGGRLFFTSTGPPATSGWAAGSPADFAFKTYVTEPVVTPPPPGGGDPATPTTKKKKCKKKKRSAAAAKKKKYKKKKKK